MRSKSMQLSSLTYYCRPWETALIMKCLRTTILNRTSNNTWQSSDHRQIGWSSCTGRLQRMYCIWNTSISHKLHFTESFQYWKTKWRSWRSMTVTRLECLHGNWFDQPWVLLPSIIPPMAWSCESIWFVQVGSSGDLDYKSHQQNSQWGLHCYFGNWWINFGAWWIRKSHRRIEQSPKERDNVAVSAGDDTR